MHARLWRDRRSSSPFNIRCWTFNVRRSSLPHNSKRKAVHMNAWIHEFLPLRISFHSNPRILGPSDPQDDNNSCQKNVHLFHSTFNVRRSMFDVQHFVAFQHFTRTLVTSNPRPLRISFHLTPRIPGPSNPNPHPLLAVFFFPS